VRGVRRIVSVLAYPLVMAAGLITLMGLLDAGVALTWAPFATVAIVGPIVILLERIIPFRRGWIANASDYLEDRGRLLQILASQIRAYMVTSLAIP